MTTAAVENDMPCNMVMQRFVLAASNRWLRMSLAISRIGLAINKLLASPKGACLNNGRL